MGDTWLYSLLMTWIIDASHSQQFYKPMGGSTPSERSPHENEYRVPYTSPTPSFPKSFDTSLGSTVSGALSIATRALISTPTSGKLSSTSGNLDPLNYEDYYDSIPYYDILEYFYIEDPIDNGNNKTSTMIKANATKKVQPNLPPMLMTSPNYPHSKNHTNMSSTAKRRLVSTASCDVVTHLGCDLTKFERCDPTSHMCGCLKGYVKARRSTKPDGSCIEATFLYGDFLIPMANRKVKSLSPQALRIVEGKLWDYIEYSMKKHNILHTLIDLSMLTSGLRSRENPSMLVLTYEIALQRNASLSTIMGQLRTVLQDDLQRATDKDAPPTELKKILGQTTVTTNSINQKTNVFMPLVEITPCSSPDHTYCSPDAWCRVGNVSQVTCGCFSGFLDVSPDPLRFPGETCEEQCQCENQGICVTSLYDFKVKECRCVEWFFGSKCHVNGKDLLIISVVCIACVLVIVTMVCCLCHARIKHRNRHTESSLFRFTPDTSILKLPRVWMEAHYPDSDTTEKEFSPPSFRRMSITTECNPYFDGYIVEDVPAGCLQSERSTDIHSPHHEATLERVRGAATVSSHSIFKHY